jgi:GNAT superfamily N-acetyltransferase
MEWTLENVPADDPAARERALGLLREVFGASFFSKEYWQWKYVANPAGASTLVAARAEDGTYLGFRALWRMSFRRGRVPVEAAQPCDTVVHPSARRLGIFSAMTAMAMERAREQGIGLVFNNPNPEAALGYARLGWHDLGGMRWYARPVRPVRIVARLAAAGGRPGPAEWADPAGPWEGVPDPDMIPFLERRLADHPATIANARSGSWLAWRYASAPHRRYGVAFAGGPGDRGAMVVYGAGRRSGLREVQLVDLTVGTRGLETARRLLAGIVERESPDWLVHAASAGSPERALMGALGFIPLPRKAALMGVSPGDERAPGGVSVVLGDLDTF